MTPEQKADITEKCCYEILKKIQGHGKVENTELWKIKRAEMIKKVCAKYDKNEKFIRKLMRL